VQAAYVVQDSELLALTETLTAALKESEAGRQALGKYTLQGHGGQVGVIGEYAQIKDGVHFGTK
jgi:hypothetical protein